MKTFLDFKAEIKSGRMRNVFFIASNDNYFVAQAGDMLREELFGAANKRENFFTKYADESPVDEIIDLANNTTSLFSQQKLVVLKRAEKYSRKINDLFESLNKIDHDTYLLVVFDRDYVAEKRYDKEKEFFDFSDLPEDKLLQLVRNEFTSRGFDISDSDLEFFVSSIPVSIDLLMNEVEKITNYDFGDSTKTITKELILKFIGYDREYSPEELMTSILTRDSNRAMKVLEGLFSSAGFSEIYLVSIISGYYMDLMSFKTKGFLQKDSSSLYGKYKMWGDKAKFARQYHNSIKISSLEKAIAKLLDTDLKLKSSMIDPKILMTSLVEELVNV